MPKAALPCWKHVWGERLQKMQHHSSNAGTLWIPPFLNIHEALLTQGCKSLSSFSTKINQQLILKHTSAQPSPNRCKLPLPRNSYTTTASAWAWSQANKRDCWEVALLVRDVVEQHFITFIRLRGGQNNCACLLRLSLCTFSGQQTDLSITYVWEVYQLISWCVCPEHFLSLCSVKPGGWN